MKYLLDVNALLAWAHPSAPDHAPFHRWKKNISPDELATCAITELGFVRISMQPFRLDLPPPAFPAWATTHGHTTDAYLCQVAAAHGLRLATFDRGIRDKTVLQLS